MDLEEAGLVVAAREAVLDAANGELLVARAHERLARPFAAAVVVDRVDVIEPGDQRAFEQGVAAARRQVPPALGGPALGVLVAKRNPDPASGVVAQAEVGRRRPERGGHERGDEREPAERGEGFTPVSAGPGGPFHHRGIRLGIKVGFRRGVQVLSTRMARKSLTLVQVGPGVSRSPSRAKNAVESLSARKAAGSRPSARARAAVVPSTKAPAGSSALPAPPSVPSVSPASAAMPCVPSSASANASAYSWLGPPRPLPRIVTVSSPPERIAARRPAAASLRASWACAAATSRASPSSRSPRSTHSKPAAATASAAARNASAGRATSRNSLRANTAAPGLGGSVLGAARARSTAVGRSRR